MWAFEIDLVSVYGSELTWFLCGGRKMLGFSVWNETSSVVVSGHRNRLAFRVGIELA